MTNDSAIPTNGQPDAHGRRVIAVEGLRKSFGSVEAVAGASFSVQKSAITALLGPNGAGKTTTLEIIAGLQHADDGHVQVLDANPWQSSARHRARVGVMLQDGGVWSTATAEQAVGHVARFYAEALSVPELLQRLKLDNKQARTPFRRLSGGEKQRVKLACAIVGRPELVILDEPSSGLDPATRIEIWSLINELRTEGTSVLLSTHSMEEAEALANRVIIMADGRVALSGDPGQLTQSSGEHCLWFRADPGLDTGAMAAQLPGDHRLIEQSPGRYRLQGAAVTPATIASVTAWCAERGVMATDLKVRERSLEDVFLEVTTG